MSRKLNWEQPYRPEDPARYDPARDPKLERSASLTDDQRLALEQRHTPEAKHTARIAKCLSKVRALEERVAGLRLEIESQKAGGRPEGPAEVWQLEAALSNAEEELEDAKNDHQWALWDYMMWRTTSEAED